jgi:hypothetical protein
MRDDDWYEVQAIIDLGGDYDRTDDDSKATEFGVYEHTCDMPESMHCESFGTRKEAEAFIKGIVFTWGGAT